MYMCVFVCACECVCVCVLLLFMLDFILFQRHTEKKSEKIVQI